MSSIPHLPPPKICSTLIRSGFALLTITTSIFSQQVGGIYETTYQSSGLSNSDWLGQACAEAGDVNGDGVTDFIIGAPGFDYAGNINSGAAFLRSGVDNSPIHSWFGDTAYSGFGSAVTGVGDLNQDGVPDIVIGAPTADPNGLRDAGVAVAYSGLDGTVLQTWQGTERDAYLGFSLDQIPDMDADGVSDVIAGAYGASSVFVFSGQTGAIVHEIRRRGIESFGYSVAHLRDYIFSDQPGIIIGAPFFDGISGANCGLVEVLYGADLYWSRSIYGLATGNQLGYLVRGVDSLEFPDNGDLLIGEPGWKNTYGETVGAVHLHNTLTWREETIAGPSSDCGFGRSFTDMRDIDQNGVKDLVIGAPLWSEEGISKAGAIFLFSTETWTEFARVSGSTSNGQLGTALSLVENSLIDGASGILVTSPYASIDGHASNGLTQIINFFPGMRFDGGTISAATGGRIHVELDFSPNFAGYNYKVLLSGSGTGPTPFGVEVPLTVDALVSQSYIGNYPIPNYTDLHGILDADGKANGEFSFPPGIPSGAIGKKFFAAAVAYRTWHLPEASSIAVEFEIVP